MRMVLDVDGVLADFNGSYVPWIISYTGKDLFPEDFDPRFPPCWDYPPVYGYSIPEYLESFAALKESPDFWRWLSPEPGAEDCAIRLDELSADHELFFITNRSGIKAKQHTEEWLRDLGVEYPTVMVAADKLPLIRALKADLFVDDRIETANDIAREAAEDPWTQNFRMYLPDRTYNRKRRRDDLIVVADLSEVLDLEGF